MHEGPGTLVTHPAVPVGELLYVVGIQSAPQCGGALAPGVGEQSSQHAIVGAVAGGDLQHLVGGAALGVVDEPAEDSPLFADRARTQAPVSELARRLSEE